MSRWDFTRVFMLCVDRNRQQLQHLREQFQWKAIFFGEQRQVLSHFRDILFGGDNGNVRVCEDFPRCSTGNGGEQDVAIGGETFYVR